jgi:phospholipid transport system transporter-binding protein
MENTQVNIVQKANKWLVSGPILMETANKLLLDSGALAITANAHDIDLLNVTEVDTAAISLMMEWQRRAATVKSKVTFSNLPDNLTSLAALYGVTEFIPLS